MQWWESFKHFGGVKCSDLFSPEGVFFGSLSHQSGQDPFVPLTFPSLLFFSLCLSSPWLAPRDDCRLRSKWGKGRARSRRGETDTHLTHWSLESLCSPERWAEERMSYLMLSFPSVSACVCVCFHVSICNHRYHYGRTGTVKAMSCSGLGGIFFESTLASEKTLIYIWVCKPLMC